MFVPVVLALLLQARTADSVTLSEALAEARAHRGVAELAAAEVAAARADRRVAGTIPDPVLTYSHTGSFPRDHLTVDQPLDWLFRRGTDRAAAEAAIQAAAADSVGKLSELARDVRIAFYSARAAVESDALLRAQQTLADSVARLAALRYRAGDISLFEREQADQEAARAAAAVLSAEEAMRVSRAELARAVGREHAEPWPAGALDDGFDSADGGAITGIEPVPVRIAVADSAAAAAASRSARVAQLPLPSLQGGAEWSDPTEPTTGATSVLGFSIPIPLWQHGAGAAAAARERARGAAATAREARVAGAAALRETGIRVAETARQARFARDSLVPAARQLRSRALRAYQAGETTILPVLDAVRNERDATLGLLQALLSWQVAVADRDALLGRTE